MKSLLLLFILGLSHSALATTLPTSIMDIQFYTLHDFNSRPVLSEFSIDLNDLSFNHCDKYAYSQGIRAFAGHYSYVEKHRPSIHLGRTQLKIANNKKEVRLFVAEGAPCTPTSTSTDISRVEIDFELKKVPGVTAEVQFDLINGKPSNARLHYTGALMQEGSYISSVTRRNIKIDLVHR